MEDLNLGIILAQLINFGIVFFIFKKFLWDKIVDGIIQRKKMLENVADAEKTSKLQMQKALDEAEEIIANAKKKAQELESKSNDLSKKQANEIILSAETKAKWIINWALRDLQKQELQMQEALKDKLLDISLKINSKILDENKANQEFIKKEINWVKI